MIRIFLIFLIKDFKFGFIQGIWRGDFGEGGLLKGFLLIFFGDFGIFSYFEFGFFEFGYCISDIVFFVIGEGIMLFIYLLYIRVVEKR